MTPREDYRAARRFLRVLRSIKPDDAEVAREARGFTARGFEMAVRACETRYAVPYARSLAPGLVLAAPGRSGWTTPRHALLHVLSLRLARLEHEVEQLRVACTRMPIELTAEIVPGIFERMRKIRATRAQLEEYHGK